MATKVVLPVGTRCFLKKSEIFTGNYCTVCPKILATSCLSSRHHLIGRRRCVTHLDGKLVDWMVGGRRSTTKMRLTARQATRLGPTCCGFVVCGKRAGRLAQAAGWPCFVVVLWAVAKEQAGWRRRQNGPALLWFCGLWQKSRQQDGPALLWFYGLWQGWRRQQSDPALLWFCGLPPPLP